MNFFVILLHFSYTFSTSNVNKNNCLDCRVTVYTFCICIYLYYCAPTFAIFWTIKVVFFNTIKKLKPDYALINFKTHILRKYLIINSANVQLKVFHKILS